MEPFIIFETSSLHELRPPIKVKNHARLKRTSPFLLLSLFLVCWLLYSFINDHEVAPIKLILFPFLITNTLFLDFAIWNFLEGKKKWLIWIIETCLSAGIVYWLL